MPTPRLTVLTTTRSVPGSAWQALTGSVRRWALDSQRGACRNAMVAGTALAARRAERQEVEEYLAQRSAPPVPQPRPAADDTPAAQASAEDRTAHA